MNPRPLKESPRRLEVPPPLDVVDGIPDRSSTRPAWKYVLMAAAFLGWLAFLVYCWLAGGVSR
jgi:hypothetical protein